MEEEREIGADKIRSKEKRTPCRQIGGERARSAILGTHTTHRSRATVSSRATTE